MSSLILYFFLLILEVFLNFTLDIIYKRSRFSEIFLEKGLKFILYKGSGPVTFNPSLMLLPAKADHIPEE